MNGYYISRKPTFEEFLMEENYLSHHGIKGQKWGVRRYQNPDGSLTDAGRKHYSTARSLETASEDYKRAKNKLKRKTNTKRFVSAAAVSTASGIVVPTYVGSFAVASVLGKKIDNKIVNKANKKYEDLIKKNNPVKLSEIEIDVGTKFNRTSLKEKETSNRRMYVGYDKDELGKEYYSKTWSTMLRKLANKPDAKVYSNQYEVNTKILAPSFEKRKEIATAIVNADKKMKTELGKKWALDQLRQVSGEYGIKTLNDLYKKTEDKATKNLYKSKAEEIIKYTVDKEFDANDEIDFTKFRASIPTSDKLMNAYIKELKKQGYGAVFDDNANTESSFIVFDPKVLTQTGSKEIK